VENDRANQDTRSRFYNSRPVVKHIRTHGARSRVAWRDMVASGSSEDSDSEKGLELIARPADVAFMKHAHQVNMMAKSRGKMIATIDQRRRTE